MQFTKQETPDIGNKYGHKKNSIDPLLFTKI